MLEEGTVAKIDFQNPKRVIELCKMESNFEFYFSKAPKSQREGRVASFLQNLPKLKKIGGGGEGGGFLLFSCAQDVVRAFTISAESGIQVQDDITLKIENLKIKGINFFNSQADHSILAKITASDRNKLTKKLILFKKIKFDPKSKKLNLVDLASEFNPSDYQIEDSVPLHTPSHRIQVRNLILVRNRQEVNMTFLAQKSAKARPKTLFMGDNEDIEDLIRAKIVEIPKWQLNLYCKVLGHGARCWHLSICKYININGGLARVEDINKSTFCQIFNFLNCFILIKIFDKLTRRVLKKVIINAGDLLIKALKSVNLYSAQAKSKKLKFTKFDFLKDEVTLEGSMHLFSQEKHLDEVCRFRMIARNCLIKKKNENFEFEYRRKN